jgi:hypothetical protein
LDQADVHLLALSVDGLGADSPSTPDDARRFMSDHRYRFAAGFADERVVQLLQLYHDTLFINRRALPIPTSFLIDTDGTVAAIYKGTVSAEQIQEDIAHLGDEQDEQRARAIPFTGRWLESSPTLYPTDLASRLVDEDMLDEAIEYLEEFGHEGHPLRPQVLWKLADKLRRQGREQLADQAAAAAAEALDSR